MAIFKVDGASFLYNDEPIQIISGAIHYFRVVPEYWEDRLLKLKACGFNTVETYVAWNIHEPSEGNFQFSGIADIEAFIGLASKLGLHVIVRPSPYICAEWEFGGLPAWLLKEPGMKLRCCDKAYLDKVDAYYDELMPRLLPLLCTNGGPIIAMQIENEYGSYGNDLNYLQYLQEGMIKRGVDVLLFTSDGAEDHMLQGGSVPEVLTTVNFGSRPEEAFAKLREYRPHDPLMCMEFWNGWFDHWGDKHHVRGFDDVADVLERMLQARASVNFYMFHGGTNFGFYNGANFFDKYEPTVTSYDYHALLNEAGDITDKYLAMREVIRKYADVPDMPIPPNSPKKAYGHIPLDQSAGLFSSLDKLSTSVQRTTPETMERLGQDYGYIVYTTHLSGPRPESKLALQDVHDRALVFANGAYLGVIERNSHNRGLDYNESDLAFAVPPEGIKLQIVVENMGRVNYGWMMNDPKGITEGVRFERQFLYDWTIHCLPMTDLSGLTYEDDVQLPADQPAFYRGFLEIVDKPCDTFLDMKGWTKGIVFINGFNLGRYWSIGPQQTLYVPAPLLKQGKNEIIVFELHGSSEASVEFVDTPNLG